MFDSYLTPQMTQKPLSGFGCFKLVHNSFNSMCYAVIEGYILLILCGSITQVLWVMFYKKRFKILLFFLYFRLFINFIRDSFTYAKCVSI